MTSPVPSDPEGHTDSPGAQDALPELPPTPPPPTFAPLPPKASQTTPAKPAGKADWSNLYKMATMGYELFLAIIVLGAVGFGLDYLLGSGPWLLVTGLVLGVVVGLYRFFREARAAVREGAGGSGGEIGGRRGNGAR